MNSKSREFIISQDWLGVNKIFFSQKTGQFSENIGNLIDYSTFELDLEGLLLYLDFGYCAFGKTPIKGISFLEQNQSLYFDEDGQLEIINNDDPSINYIETISSEENTWELIESNIRSFCDKNINKTLCVPTSGGFDSRLINFFSPRKEQIKAFTYGLSYNPEKSFEVIKAKNICEKLNIDWNIVEIGYFNRFITQWIEDFNISSHAHGMYHYEFYTKIKEQNKIMPLISGIIGDLWAGSTSVSKISSPRDMINLGLTRGLNFDREFCLLNKKIDSYEREFEEKKDLLKNSRYRIISLIRKKIMLLSYLIKVPSNLGFECSSPFLDFNICMSMLTIEPSRWEDRKWQRDFFLKNNLDLSHLNKKSSYRNDLDFNSMILHPLDPLNVDLLSPIFKKSYIEWINKNIVSSKLNLRVLHWAINTKYLRSIFPKLGINDKSIVAYNSYLVLKPLEEILKKVKQVEKK